MIRRFSCALLAALALSLTGISHANDYRDEAGFSVTLDYQRPLFIADAGFTAELDKVIDARCPADVQCVHSGYAEIQLNLSNSEGLNETLTLGWPSAAAPNINREVVYQTFLITLQRLTPVLTLEQSLKPNAYQATLKLLPLAP